MIESCTDPILIGLCTGLFIGLGTRLDEQLQVCL
jgi:hypothetical protein